jgi:hypothetical protein
MDSMFLPDSSAFLQMIVAQVKVLWHIIFQLIILDDIAILDPFFRSKHI